MHDNRVITEGRIDRFVRDILIPALYIETMPLTIGVWDDLDEPLPFADARRRSPTGPSSCPTRGARRGRRRGST